MIYAFDMFGTLADTSSVRDELQPLAGAQASQLAVAWRRQQLEYMFRVTAMGQFPSFADLTAWALTAVLADAQVQASSSQIEHLAQAYSRLAPFDDVRPALESLRDAEQEAVVFSVGPREWLEALASSYRPLVRALVSAQDAGVYKPHPHIYRHLLRGLGAEPAQVSLVSGNPFDLIGGAAVGLRTVWCRRDPAASFDPWGPRPDHVVGTLGEIATLAAL